MTELAERTLGIRLRESGLGIDMEGDAGNLDAGRSHAERAAERSELAAQVRDAITDAPRGKPLTREINSWMQAHPTGS